MLWFHNISFLYFEHCIFCVLLLQHTEFSAAVYYGPSVFDSPYAAQQNLSTVIFYLRKMTSRRVDCAQGHSSWWSWWSHHHPVNWTIITFWQRICYLCLWTNLTHWFMQSFVRNTADRVLWRGYWTLCEYKPRKLARKCVEVKRLRELRPPSDWLLESPLVLLARISAAISYIV